MKCNSIAINEVAAELGGSPKYLGHTGEGDQRLTLWEMPNGEEMIETSGDPLDSDSLGWAEARAAILA